MSPEVITITDARKAGYCVRGAREWHRQRGLDWKKFLKEGMPLDEAAALNDAVVNHIIAVKRGVSRG